MSTTTLELRSLITTGGELRLSLEEVPVAAPGPDEVVVRVDAAPINPSDLGTLLGPADVTTLSVDGSSGRPVVTAKIPPQFAPSAAARTGKSLPIGLEGAGVVVASVTPYGADDQRTDFTASRIAIQKMDGTVVKERLHPSELAEDGAPEHNTLAVSLMIREREWTQFVATPAMGLQRSAAKQIVAVFIAACLVDSCRGAGVLDPQGPIASAERLILLNATAIMLVVVLPVIILTLAFAWWYRASNKRAVYWPDWSYSGDIELVVWSIPAMVVILLAGVAWTGSHLLDPARELKSDVKPIRIEVVSLDWKWLFIYPDLEIATVNQLVVPTGVPIEFLLTSATVMNSFFVPQLGSQIYTMPGMTTRLNLLAERPGDYPGLSANFSGDGFSDMRFLVHVVPASEFSSWRTRATDEGAVLNADAYLQLARTAGNTQMQTYRSVDPDLFERIVQQNGAAEPTASAPKEH